MRTSGPSKEAWSTRCGEAGQAARRRGALLAGAARPALFLALRRSALACSARHLRDAILSAFQTLAIGVTSQSPGPFRFQAPKPVLLFWLLLWGSTSGGTKSPKGCVREWRRTGCGAAGGAALSPCPSVRPGAPQRSPTGRLPARPAPGFTQTPVCPLL